MANAGYLGSASFSIMFHDGLNDLKEKPLFIKHKCHEVGYQHDRCFAAVYSAYINKVQGFAVNLQSFYFRPQWIIEGMLFLKIFLRLILHLTSQMVF